MAPQVDMTLWGWTATTVQAGSTINQPGYDEDREEYDATIYTGEHKTLEQNTVTILRRDSYGVDIQWVATVEDINDPIHEPMNTITIQARFSWE